MFILNKKAYHCLLLLQALFLIFPNEVRAQNLPSTPELTPDTDKLFQEPELETEPLPSISIPTLSVKDIPDLTNISTIKIIGSTIFSQAELNSILEPLQNRNFTKTELLKVINKINKLYSDRGYITSGILTPPKILENQIVTLEIREGIIEDFVIIGLTRLESDYVISRLNLDKEKPFNSNQFRDSLQLLHRNNLIENIAVKIIPGSSLGNNVLEINIEESDPFYAELSIDNLGSPSIGSNRRSLQLVHNNLLGFGDRFKIGYTNTDGSNSIDGITYTIPLNSDHGTLHFGYSYGNAEIVEEPLDALDIELRAREFLLSYRQPVYRTPTQEFALGLTFNRAITRTRLLNTPFRLVRGASSNGEITTSALRFHQDYIGRSKRDWFILRSEFSLGVDAFDDTVNNDEPDTHFFLWRGQTWYQRKLTSDITLSFKSYLQLADRPLVISEQTLDELFTVNREEGTFLLRGYRQNSLVADNGVFASAELRASIIKIPQWDTILQITPFIDFGTAWNDDDVNIEESTLTSVGLGLRLLVGEAFRARVDWGIPLVDQDDFGDSLQEDGITFNLEYRPF